MIALDRAAFECWPITPMGKPRMTQRDKWKKRGAVLEYWAFKDELRLRGVTVPASGYHLVFVLPMPATWSKKKRAAMAGEPHEGKPDRDNLEKAVLDALYGDDAHIWDGHTTKIWGEQGEIWVGQCACVVTA